MAGPVHDSISPKGRAEPLLAQTFLATNGLMPHPNSGGLRVWKSVASCQALATLSVSASAHS